MQKFPEIKEGEVALIRVDTNTGIVLDNLFKRYRDNNNQIAYTVFEQLQTAKEYANEFLATTNLFEFVIYDHQNELIECLSPYPRPMQ